MRTNTLGIIDLGHLFWKKWHSEFRQAEESYTHDRVMSVVDSTVMWAEEWARMFSLSVVAVDAPPYTRRLAALPTYKANRPEKPKESVEALVLVQAKLNRKMPVIRVQGAEADDIIATAVSRARAAGYDSCILTRDKDLFQLIARDVTIVSMYSGVEFGVEECIRKFGGLEPDQVLDYLALVGDASDGVPGAPGIGDKTAIKLLTEWEDISNILDAAAAGRLSPTLNSTLSKKDTIDAIWTARDVCSLDIVDSPELDALFASSAPSETIAEVAPVGELVEALEASIVATGGRLSTPPPSRREELLPPPVVAKDVQLANAPLTIELRPGLTVSKDQFSLIKDMAVMFDKSRMYQRLGGVEAIFTVMALGLEVGISPQVALNCFHCIEGKPSPTAHFLVALAKKDPNCEYLECVEESDKGATYATKKRSGYTQEMRFSYTIKDAEADGHRWVKSSKNLRAMLRKTAGSQAARLWYPEACLGLYSAEEMGAEV